MTPIYSSLRWFLGQRDLVVSLRTRGCRFGCSFCNLPSRSLDRPVTPGEVRLQMEEVLAACRERAAEVRRVSIGCEGSLLDSAQLTPESLGIALEFVRDRLRVDTVSFETRPEFVTDESLGRMRRILTSSVRWDATIGLETVDERIRNGVLRKRLSLAVFEKAAEAMARIGGTLTVYVMMKPLPWMNEADAIEDASRTLRYLIGIRSRYEVPVVAYLNPMYLARGTWLAREASRRGGRPPSFDSVLEVLRRCRDWSLPAYLGAWSEGLAEERGDWACSEAWDLHFWRRVVAYNRSGDLAALEGDEARGVFSDEVGANRSA